MRSAMPEVLTTNTIDVVWRIFYTHIVNFLNHRECEVVWNKAKPILNYT